MSGIRGVHGHVSASRLARVASAIRRAFSTGTSAPVASLHALPPPPSLLLHTFSYVDERLLADMASPAWIFVKDSCFFVVVHPRLQCPPPPIGRSRVVVTQPTDNGAPCPVSVRSSPCRCCLAPALLGVLFCCNRDSHKGAHPLDITLPSPVHIPLSPAPCPLPPCYSMS